jgi:hypothetical protein
MGMTTTLSFSSEVKRLEKISEHDKFIAFRLEKVTLKNYKLWHYNLKIEDHRIRWHNSHL